MVGRVYVVNNNIEWTDDKVLHLIDLLKDVSALYVVNWIYVWRSRVRESCLCTPAHQLFAAQVAATYKLDPSLQPLAYLRSMIEICRVKQLLERCEIGW